MFPDWLTGITAKALTNNIWEISITGYGPAEVGPYKAFKDFVGDRAGLEAHHIVGKEHLRMVPTRFSEDSAPAVLIPQCLHRKLMSPRITGEQNYLGGRPSDGTVLASRKEIIHLYEQVYTWHSPFKELFTISKYILTVDI